MEKINVGNKGEVKSLFSANRDDIQRMFNELIDTSTVPSHEPMTIRVLVHDGVFHADDVVSVALIKICAERMDAVIDIPYPFKKIEVIRSRKVDDFIKENEGYLYLVTDVGGGKYDHHNKERETYPNGVMYSAVGKILRDISNELISEKLKEELLINGLYGVQAQDNGQKNLTKEFQNPFNFVHQLNANWTENLVGQEQDAAFDRAVEMAETVLKRLFQNCEAKILGEEKVKEAIQVSGDSPIVILPKFISGWQATVVQENCRREEDTKIKFVVFSQGNQYRVQAVPVENGSFEVLTKLSGDFIGEKPEDTPEKIKNLIGKDDAVFCHPGRFIAGAKSKETCIAMAEYSLK